MSPKSQELDVTSCQPCECPQPEPSGTEGLCLDNLNESLVELWVDWTLKTKTVNVAGGATPTQLVEDNPSRIKLDFYLYQDSGSAALANVSQNKNTLSPTTNGIPLKVQTATAAPRDLISRSIEEDKAETTHAWYAATPAGNTALFFISEVIFSGNTRRCRKVSDVWPT